MRAFTLTTLMAAATCLVACSASFCDTTDGWTRVWGDEFDGGELDESAWNVLTGKSDGECRSAVCDADDVYLESGNLVLRSRRSTDYPYSYTTGAVSTTGKRTWRDSPGFRMCVSAVLPGRPGEGGQGIW